MWLFTRHGFYSVVCAKTGDDRHGQPPDTNRVMVRARVRAHLEALKERFPELLRESEIRSSAGTDYAYRVFMPKAVWIEIAGRLADEIDYDNFKSRVARDQGDTGALYERSLHEVWSVMRRIQRS